MCNARALGSAALVAATVYTGGAAAGLWGAAAEAGGAAAFTGATSTGLATVAGEGAATAGGLSSLQTASLLASAAGTGAQVYGQYQQAEAAKSAAEYNQKVANLQAQDAQDRGVQDQEALGRKISALRGQQRANMAANGLDLSSGTPEALLDQTDYYGLEDQRTLQNNINREVATYKNRSNLYGVQADSTSPMLAASGSFLTGAGAVADKWYRYNSGGRAYATELG